MELARVDYQRAPHWVEIDGDDVFNLSGNRFDPRRGKRLCARSEARLLAPIEATNKVVALMGNFTGTHHRKGPGLFIKPNSAIIADGELIVWPLSVERINLEAELGVVIGKPARNVDQADSLNYVLGYTVTNDVTSFSMIEEEGFDSLSLRFKLYDSFLPIGPHIVTDIDPSDLRLCSRVNGMIKQDVSTAKMDFSVAQTVAWVSSVMRLDPGDIISMGTPPGFCDIVEGDVTECEIAGIGILKNRVIRESA